MALSAELQEEIAKLVQRANHGDQNAMAMIEQVRKNAQGGVALAQESHKAIMQCVMGQEGAAASGLTGEAKQVLGALKNPAISPDRLLQILCFVPHVADGILVHAACVILSKLPESKVAVVQSMVPPPPVQASGEFGVAPGEWDGHCPPMGNGISPNCIPWRGPSMHGAGLASGAEVSFGYAAHALDHARRIQAIRNRRLPPSQMSAGMGWELDC
jgi:hypothetical protein